MKQSQFSALISVYIPESISSQTHYYEGKSGPVSANWNLIP